MCNAHNKEKQTIRGGDIMCNAHNIVAYCCELWDYERIPLYMIYKYHGYKKAVQSCFMIRSLMYSIAARMVLDGEY